MANAQVDLTKEITLLKEQVVAFVAARKAESKALSQEAVEAPREDAGADATGLDTSHLIPRLEGLLEQLKRDVGETPTTTCLAIFTLGLLLGRAIAR
jgi:hypothetical protein